MYILGLNAYHADSSAALFKNGEMIVALENNGLAFHAGDKEHFRLRGDT